ncbi:MAG: gluconate 2-dehydrogenase subunit 3 family protein [Reichenbachiella sp.]
MNRRDVLKSVSLLVGGSVIGGELFLTGCSFNEDEVGVLSKSQMLMIEEIAETILPKTTKSPGAKEAMVGEPIKNIVTRFYSTVERQVLIEGLEQFEINGFIKMTAELKEAHLISVEKSAKLSPTVMVTDKEGKRIETKNSFEMIRQLSIWGYFSSEIVAKNAFNYLPVPGTFEACVEVTSDVKPMAPNHRFGAKLNL